MVKTAKLLEIFNKEQAKELKNILVEAKRKNIDPLELTDVFKQFFSKWESGLMSKEILHDYLAYAFAFALSKAGYDKAINELNMIIAEGEKGDKGKV